MQSIANHCQQQEALHSDLRALVPSVDTLGMAVSSLCLVHCLVMPFLVMLLPALGSFYSHDDRTHYLLAGFVLAFCLLAVVPGYMRHNSKLVLALMVGGLSLVLFATFAVHFTFGEMWEIPLITVGNLVVVAAHRFNQRLCRCQHN